VDARLYLIVEAAAEAVLEPALDGGVDIVQLREKEADDEAIVAAGRRFRAICERHGALLIVNDRADLALACGAHGVHLGQDDEAVESVRATVGEGMVIGLSTHSPEQIAAANATSADYIGVGPVFETATKPGVPAVGLELVRHAAAHATKPWFAIGGIEPGNADAVVAAGARRLAVVRAIRDAPDPRAAARSLIDALEPEPASHGVE
jgi:thiamine-phosphate pyrophosphorylase